MSNPAAKYIDEFRRETAGYIISTGRPIMECCAELGLNSKTGNKWVQSRRRELADGPDPKAENRELREAVRRVRLESDRRFGFQFAKCFLPGEFSGPILYRVRKSMRELGIRGCTPNAGKRTTIPNPKAGPRPDLVRRDNATAESFFATLKSEMHYRRSFPTRDSAKQAVVKFIEAYYNRRRPHSTIGYKVPAEAMAAFLKRTAPKPEAMPMTA